MTQLDVLFRYGNPPSESTILALAKARNVYGIRRVTFDEQARTVRVEYDTTRLGQPVVHQLLRRAGLDITETIALNPHPTDTAPVRPVTPSVTLAAPVIVAALPAAASTAQ